MKKQASRKYSTVQEHLAYLNKQKLAEFSDTFPDSAISDFANFRQTATIIQTPHDVTSGINEAFMCELTVASNTELTLTPTSIPSVFSAPCTIFWEDNLTPVLQSDGTYSIAGTNLANIYTYDDLVLVKLKENTYKIVDETRALPAGERPYTAWSEAKNVLVGVLTLLSPVPNLAGRTINACSYILTE